MCAKKLKNKSKKEQSVLGCFDPEFLKFVFPDPVKVRKEPKTSDTLTAEEKAERIFISIKQGLINSFGFLYHIK